MATIHGPFYRLSIYTAILLLVGALLLLFVILTIEYIAQEKNEYGTGQADTEVNGSAILDEIAADANPNAVWIAGTVNCTNFTAGPACNESTLIE